MMNKSKYAVPLLIHDVAHQMRLVIDSKVAPFNLTRQKWVALSLVDQKPGISQIELAGALDIDRSTAGRLLDRMEKRGLIRRQKDTADRRITRVYIEAEAKPVLENLHDVSHEIKSVSASGLSDQEQNELVRLLGKMHKNLKTGFGGFAFLLELPEELFFMLKLM